MVPESLIKTRNQVFLYLPIYTFLMQVWSVDGFEYRLKGMIFSITQSHLFTAIVLYLPMLIFSVFMLYLFWKLCFGVMKNKVPVRSLLFRDEFEKHEMQMALALTFVVMIMAIFAMQLSVKLGGFREFYLNILGTISVLPWFFRALLDSYYAKRS